MLVIAQTAGLLPLVVLVPLLPGTVSRPDLLWSMAAGLASSGGVGLLYRALAIGTMSIVAPTTAVCAVVLPVVVDAAGGARLGAIVWAGIALALVAIVLVSRPGPGPGAAAGPQGPAPRLRARTVVLAPGFGLALASGLGIGLFFIALARTSEAAGVWPLVVGRSVSVVLFSAVAFARRQRVRVAGPVLRVVIACGILEVLANALYIVATRGGPLSVVVTLASLYPASTVLLARLVIGERLSRHQTAGVVCALVAVVLIVNST